MTWKPLQLPPHATPSINHPHLPMRRWLQTNPRFSELSTTKKVFAATYRRWSLIIDYVPLFPQFCKPQRKSLSSFFLRLKVNSDRSHPRNFNTHVQKYISLCPFNRRRIAAETPIRQLPNPWPTTFLHIASWVQRRRRGRLSYILGLEDLANGCWQERNWILSMLAYTQHWGLKLEFYELEILSQHMFFILHKIERCNPPEATR